MGFPGLSPRFLHSPRGHPEDGKAQVTREPIGYPEADGARDPSRPPRPQPPRASTGPIPRAATGPIPRVPAAPNSASGDPWSGTAPGFEFEGRRSRPGRGPKRTQPGQPPQPGRDQDPRGRPDSRPPEAPREPPRFRYTPTVSQPPPVPPAWPDDDQPAMPGFEFNDSRRTSPRPASSPSPASPAPVRPTPVRPTPVRLAPVRLAPVRPAPNGPGCCARCYPSRPNAGGPGSSWPDSISGAGGPGSRSLSSPWSSSVSPSS